MSGRRAALALVLLAMAGQSCGDGPTGPEAAAAAAITPWEVYRLVAALADDSMRGRATPSPELAKALALVAGELSREGISGGGPDGGYAIQYLAPGALVTDIFGVLEGADSLLAGEVVLVTAHVDHLGVGPPVNGDSIYNGADDNASGTAGLLAIARAFARLQPRPRRTVAFAVFSGEERGLWGSTAFADDPPIPLTRIVAAINLDMIGRNAPDVVGVAGMDQSDLGDLLTRTAAAHGEVGLTIAPFADQGRSDHAPFAQRGIPYLFFHTGLHADYHQPSDSPDHIDAAKAARVAKLAFYAAAAIANADARPAPTVSRRPVGPSIGP